MSPLCSARLSALAYLPPESIESAAAELHLSRLACFDEGGTEGFVAVRAGRTVVAFRGTQLEPLSLTLWDVLTLKARAKARQALADLLFDLRAYRVRWAGAARVHAGFRAALQQALDAIHELAAARRTGGIDVVGHSLGGALALLYAGELLVGAGHNGVPGVDQREPPASAPSGGCAPKTPLRPQPPRPWHAQPSIRVDTFGCPAVADEAAALQIMLGCERIRNYQRCADVVPRLLDHATGFYRPGPLRYLDRRCREQVNPSCVERLFDRWLARLEDLGRWGLVDVKHHFIEGYVKCLEESA